MDYSYDFSVKIFRKDIPQISWNNFWVVLLTVKQTNTGRNITSLPRGGCNNDIDDFDQKQAL